MRDYAQLVAELREYQQMAEELAARIDEIKDEIKAGLSEQNLDTIVGKDFKITYKPVFTDRIDTKALKSEMPELAARYMKTSVAKRLVIK